VTCSKTVIISGSIRNVDPNAVSVSGFSSGGAMSMQFHFVYSQFLKGAGIFAGCNDLQ
jgi:poly(3-hydroxybutyrate) depolymerase